MTETHFCWTNGDRIAYRDEGDGEILLLVHGVTGNSETWRELIPRLAGDFRVIAPDLLGHGKSDKPAADYSLGGLAGWLRDFMDAVGITRATIVGQSLGGGIAMQFAYQHRTRCERLILIGSGGLEPELSWPLRVLSAPGAELLLPVIAPLPVREVGNRIGALFTAAGLGSQSGAALWTTLLSMADGPSRTASLHTLRSVADCRGQDAGMPARPYLTAQLPVQLIWGARDKVVPVQHGYAAHEAMPGSRLSVLADVGHFPHVESPDLVDGIIRDFIATTQRRSTLITRC